MRILAREVLPVRIPRRRELAKFMPIWDDSLSHPGTRLKMRLLVFQKPRQMREFWNRAGTGDRLCSRTLGFVNDLTCERFHIHPDGRETNRVREVDRRHFCVMGLCVGHLTMRIITHECVHAGFAAARRMRNVPWADQVLQLDEEAVCYPAGEIARSVVQSLTRAGLMQP